MPLKGEVREKWINVITKQQELSALTYFNVCSLHFDEQNITKSGKLISGSVPSLYR